ncbi:vascular endothelial growth factor receptor kdr-like isoform X2 [Hydra vulgaris]|uniref:Vascular endothelial growth factor receptor kdr-like isoform X2 n=2 Tax=Hydra vulgaris TaxID=6087 RepID=A0ABM4D6B1_HYDVU
MLQYFLVLVYWAQVIQISDELTFKDINTDLLRPAFVGETVEINCVTDSSSISLMLIKKDKNSGSEQILQPDNSTLKLVNQKFNLLISGKENDGEYVCLAEEIGQKIEKSVTIFVVGTVSDKITEPAITNPFIQIDEGGILEIKCSTTASFAKLSWLKNTDKVADNNILKIKPYFRDGKIVTESVLVINDVNLNDKGTYTCLSSSRFDRTKTANTGAKVIVNARNLNWLENKSDLKNAIVTSLGSDAIISCLMSHPAKKVKFLKYVSGGLLKEIQITDSKYRLINNQELAIQKVSSDDFGIYVCRSEKIEDKNLQLLIDSSDPDPFYLVVSPQNKLNLSYYGSKNVTCKTYGYNTKLEWLVERESNGQLKLIPVPFEKIAMQSRQTEQGNTEKIWTLMLTRVTKEDAGNYVCKGSIDKRVGFRDLKVFVNGPVIPQIKEFKSVMARVSSKVSLTCKVNGIPSPSVEFYKDDNKIITGGQYTIMSKKLVINKVRYPEDDGIYKCVIKNMFGKVVADATLSVIVLPTIDKSEKYVLVPNAKDLKVGCVVISYNPKPNITWEYQPWSCPINNTDCDPVTANWKVGEEADVILEDKNSTLKSYFQVPESDVRKFFIRCIAQNQYGKDVHQVVGIVDQRDASSYLKIEPKSISVDEDSLLNLTCTGQAGLFLALLWQKNGLNISSSDDLTVTETGSFFETKVSVLTVENPKSIDSGKYFCIGIPAREGKNVVLTSQVTIRSIFKPEIKLMESVSIFDGTTAFLSCIVKSHPVPEVQWYKSGSVISDISKLSHVKDCKNSRKGSFYTIVSNMKEPDGLYNYTLMICNSDWKVNNDHYKCEVKNKLGVDSQTAEIKVFSTPQMIHSQVSDYALLNQEFIRNCTAIGNPMPYVWWEKEIGNRFNIVTLNSSSGISFLNFSVLKSHHYGSYRCVARNDYGFTYDSISIKKPIVVSAAYQDNKKSHHVYLIGVLVASILLFVILIVIAVVLIKRKRLYGGFYLLSAPPAPDYFKKLDPTKSIAEQIHKLPYFPEWEFPRNKITLKTCVGSGAFGEVYIADAYGIDDFDPRYKISMKHKAFIRRLSLRKSLLVRNDSLNSSKLSKSGKNKVPKPVAVKRLKENATQVEYKDLISEMKILIHIGKQENIVNLLGACTKGVEKETYILLEYCPHGNLLSYMKNRRQEFKPIWSKQFIGMEQEFTTFDLAVICYQVAKGLEFLASRKCVHRDVAARNVLVGENFTMKVADFGLARDVHQDERYVKVSGGLLPIKWMAVESILERVFTHMSDVWSYGVLMWEVMTLGGSPYPGLPTKDLTEYLIAGHRMAQPQFCPNEIYVLMRECWNEDWTLRPAFADIVTRVANIIEEHCRPTDVAFYLDKSHIKGSLPVDCNNVQSVNGQPSGSYNFSPPPSYLQSFGDPRIHSEKEADDEVFLRSPSERYVSQKKPSITVGDGYEKAVDKTKADSAKVFIDLPTVDDDADGCESTELTPLYQNSNNPPPQVTTKSSLQIPGENLSFLRRSPTPIEDLCSFLDTEYANVGATTMYANLN